MRDDCHSGWSRSRSFRKVTAPRETASRPPKRNTHAPRLRGCVRRNDGRRARCRHCARLRCGALRRRGHRTFERCRAFLRLGARLRDARSVHVYLRMHCTRRAESCDSCCVGAASNFNAFPENGEGLKAPGPLGPKNLQSLLHRSIPESGVCSVPSWPPPCLASVGSMVIMMKMMC